MIDYIAPVLAAISAIVAAALAYKGTKDTDSTDKLSRAAGLYSDYADKMEKRLTAVEQKNAELSEEQTVITDRLETSEKEAEIYKKESNEYKHLILEVIQWITELLDWELRDYNDPRPHFTLSMVLKHLTNFMQSRNNHVSDSSKKEGSSNGT